MVTVMYPNSDYFRNDQIRSIALKSTASDHKFIVCRVVAFCSPVTGLIFILSIKAAALIFHCNTKIKPLVANLYERVFIFWTYCHTS